MAFRRNNLIAKSGQLSKNAAKADFEYEPIVSRLSINDQVEASYQSSSTLELLNQITNQNLSRVTSKQMLNERLNK